MRHSTPTTSHPTRATTTRARRAPHPNPPRRRGPTPPPRHPAPPPESPAKAGAHAARNVIRPPLRPHKPRAPPRSFPRTRESRLRTASNFRNATPPNPPRKRGATPPTGRLYSRWAFGPFGASRLKTTGNPPISFVIKRCARMLPVNRRDRFSHLLHHLVWSWL